MLQRLKDFAFADDLRYIEVSTLENLAYIIAICKWDNLFCYGLAVPQVYNALFKCDAQSPKDFAKTRLYLLPSFQELKTMTEKNYTCVGDGAELCYNL